MDECRRKVLVFTQFREMGDILSQMIEQRQEMVERFQNNSRTDRIFLLSLKAASTGLNLTVATGESWIGKLSNKELRELFE